MFQQRCVTEKNARSGIVEKYRETNTEQLILINERQIKAFGRITKVFTIEETSLYHFQ